MNPEIISIASITTFIALVVTAVFQYAPKLNVWWGGLAINHKKLGVAALYLVAGAVVAWGGCIVALKEIFPALLCAQPATFIDYAFGVFLAVAMGQGVFGLAPEAKAVTEVKAERDAAILAATK
jgi:hypothetical protein